MAEPTEYDFNLTLADLTVPCNELPDSCRLDFGKDGPTGTRKFHVPWARRLVFVREMLGGPVFEDNKLIGYFDAVQFPDQEQMVATRVQTEGVGAITQDEDGNPVYQAALVTIIYEVPKTDGGGGQTEEERTLSTESLDFSAEALLAPGKAFTWTAYTWNPLAEGGLGGQGTDRAANVGVPVLAQVPILMPTIIHTYTKTDVAVLPGKLLRATIGRVNRAWFPKQKTGEDPNITIEKSVRAGMLLFEGCSARRTLTSKGQKNYELTFTFRERVIAPWNCIWNPTNSEWTAINPAPYQNADFDPLFTLATA